MSAGLAAAYLAAWMRIAANWPAKVDSEGVRRCTECGKGIMLVTDTSGRPYCYTPDQVDALTVLHLRSHHADLDPNKAS